MDNQIQSDAVELQQYISGINSSIPQGKINVKKDTKTQLQGNTKASACIDAYISAVSSFNEELKNVVSNLNKAAQYFEDTDNETANGMSGLGQ